MEEAMETSTSRTAEHFVAEAMATDMARWIVFDPKERNPDSVAEEFEQWLKENLPSQTYMYVGSTIPFYSAWKDM